MKTFKKILNELKLKWEVPKEPGSTPIPPDHVRLYHQTSSQNLSPIRRKGIESRQPVEGPKGIYADEKGFYGNPEDTPSVEFSVPKSDYRAPFVHQDVVEPKSIIATHKPWHRTVRYIDDDPEIKQAILRGEHDDLLNDPHYSKAIRFVKKREKALQGKN